MSVIKHNIIAEEYNISNATVTRWVELALEGKNSLQLDKSKNKFRVIDNSHNRTELRRLSEEGKKYRPTIYAETVEPSPDFYDIFNEEQIVEIIMSLKTGKEIPFKYAFMGPGYNYWKEFLTESSKHNSYKVPSMEKNALKQIINYLQYKVSRFSKVNIIDICPIRNGFITSELLADLQSFGLNINRYLIADIDAEILNLEQEHIQNTLKIDSLPIEKYIWDIEKNNAAPTLLKLKNDPKTINLIFCMGSILGNVTNLHKTLSNLEESLDSEDLLIFSGIPAELVPSRLQVKFADGPNYNRMILWIADMLDLDTGKSEIVFNFDSIRGKTNKYLKSYKDYTIEFALDNTIHKVEIEKGQEIRLHPYHFMSLNKIFQNLMEINLKLCQLTISEDVLLVICQSGLK